MVPQTEPIRVFLLDDHEVVRDGLRALIELTDDMCVVGESSTCADALAQVVATCPDVAILDVRLADGSGIDVCREIRTTAPEVRVLMLTTYSDSEAMIAAAEAGASGYVVKQARGRELLDSIRQVASGRSSIDLRAADRVAVSARRERERASAEEPRLRALTARQRRVLALIAQGRTNRQIAAELALSEKSVKNCVSSILLTLGVSRRVEAAVLATQLHVTDDERGSVASAGAPVSDGAR